MVNMNCGTRLGRERRPFAIREYLDAKGITYRDISARAGVHTSLVQRTIRGNANNRKVLAALVECGVPRQALALPPDMTRDSAA